MTTAPAPSTKTSTAFRHASAVLLGMVAPAVALCEDDKKGWFGFGGKKGTTQAEPESSAPQLDLGSVMARIQTGTFWDELGKKAGSTVQSGLDSGIPTQLSYGFISGYCSGLALKKIGKAAGVIFGKLPMK
jgi:FUN14 family